MIEEVKHLFTASSMVSFRSPRKISSYLVRVKLYPVERPVWSYHVARFALPVRLYYNLTKLIVNMTAWGKRLIFPVTFKKCRKQCVGQTVDTFCYRWNNHRSDSCNHAHDISYMQEHPYEYFCDTEHGGFLKTFLDKNDPTNSL